MRSDIDQVNALFVLQDESVTERVWQRVRRGMGVHDKPWWTLCDHIYCTAMVRYQLDLDLPYSPSLFTVLPAFPWEDAVCFFNVHEGRCYVADGQKVRDLVFDEVWWPSSDVLLIVSDCHPVVALVEDFGRVSMARMDAGGSGT